MQIIAVKVFQLKQLKRSNLKKNSGLNGDRTHVLCDTGAVLRSVIFGYKIDEIRKEISLREAKEIGDVCTQARKKFSKLWLA